MKRKKDPRLGKRFIRGESRELGLKKGQEPRRILCLVESYRNSESSFGGKKGGLGRDAKGAHQRSRWAS